MPEERHKRGREEKVIDENDAMRMGVHGVWKRIRQESISVAECAGCRNFYYEAHRREGRGCRAETGCAKKEN